MAARIPLPVPLKRKIYYEPYLTYKSFWKIKVKSFGEYI